MLGDPGGERRFGIIKPVFRQRIGSAQQARITRRRGRGQAAIDGAMTVQWQEAGLPLSPGGVTA